MKVLDHLKRSMPISFELIPPRRGGSIERLLGVIGELVDYKPSFIDVTSHAAQVVRSRKKRKSPGTLPICMLIQERYGIDAVAHVLCQGFTKEETEDFLIDLNFAGVNNLFAVRGDEVNYETKLEHGRSRNLYAVDLVKQIRDMNNGVYLDNLVDAESTNFHIGVAGYPEKHFAALDMETDVRYLKEKIEAGADYIVTQMFFDNERYFSFVDRCREAGIEVPIVPGLKVITSKRQLRKLPEMFHVEIPEDLESGVMGSGGVVETGAAWTAKQAEGLLKYGIPSLHFYVMQNANPVHTVIKYLNG